VSFPRNQCVRVLVACAIWMTAGARDAAADIPAGYHRIDPYQGEALCGIYSLYAAAAALGKEIDPQALVKPEFIGSAEGSSSAELQRAAAAVGVHCVPAANLNLANLRRSPYPILLLVRASLDDAIPNHWVTAFASHDQTIELFDPMKGRVSIPAGELAARWNGVGLILNDGPIDLALVNTWTSRFIGGCLVGGAIVVLAMHGISRRFQFGGMHHPRGVRLRNSVLAAAAIVAMTAGFAFCYHRLSPDGLLANAEVRQRIAVEGLVRTLPELSIDEVRQLAEAGAFLVDARLPEDFDRGHLPHAVNLPARLNLEQTQRVMRAHAVEPARAIVVYCGNRDCPYAQRVARNLHLCGYKDIRYYRGGWEEWSRAGFANHD